MTEQVQLDVEHGVRLSNSCPDSGEGSDEQIDSHLPSLKQQRNLLQPKGWPFYWYRRSYREYFAEFFGTMILIFFGDGVCATAKFNGGDFSSYQSNANYLAISFGWGAGLAMALFVSLGASGGHLNPAVTFTNSLLGTFPWRKVPGYMLAQLLGAMTGASCVYGLFKDHFDTTKANLADGVSMTQAVGGIFCTYPNVSNKYAVLSEVLNTAVLMMGILAIFDSKMTPAVNFKPLAVGLLVFTIGICTGWNSGYAINPARDFGPRIISAFLFGSDPFTSHANYFWIPLFIPFIGATLGGFLYSFFIIPNDPEDEKRERD